MRGPDEHTHHMFSYLSPEQRVPADHPLRAVRALTDHALKTMSRRLAGLYARGVRRSRPSSCCARWCCRCSERTTLRLWTSREKPNDTQDIVDRRDGVGTAAGKRLLGRGGRPPTRGRGQGRRCGCRAGAHRAGHRCERRRCRRHDAPSLGSEWPGCGDSQTPAGGGRHCERRQPLRRPTALARLCQRQRPRDRGAARRGRQPEHVGHGGRDGVDDRGAVRQRRGG